MRRIICCGLLLVKLEPAIVLLIRLFLIRQPGALQSLK